MKNLEFGFEIFDELEPDYETFKERVSSIHKHFGEMENRSVEIIRQMEDGQRWDLFNEGIERAKDMLGRDEPVVLCLADNTPSGGSHVVFGFIHPGYPLLVEIPQRPREQFATELHVLDAFRLVIGDRGIINDPYKKVAFIPRASMRSQLNCLADIPDPILLPLPEKLDWSNVVILEHNASKNKIITADVIALGYWRWLQENHFETAWNHTMIKQIKSSQRAGVEVTGKGQGNGKIIYTRLSHQEAVAQFDLYHSGKLPLHSSVPIVWSIDDVCNLRQIDNSPDWELLLDTMPMIGKLLKTKRN